MQKNFELPLDGYLGHKCIKYYDNKWQIKDESGQDIQVLSLHFQGEAKKLISYFYLFKHRFIFQLIYIYKLRKIILNLIK